jgi:hypothetical protein
MADRPNNNRDSPVPVVSPNELVRIVIDVEQFLAIHDGSSYHFATLCAEREL